MPSIRPDVPAPVRDAVARAVALVPEIGLAMLFGSLARGEAGPESDLDLAVMAPRPLAPTERVALTERLAELGRPVDVVDLSAAHGAVVGEVFATGVRIVETDACLYPERLARHLVDEADFGPLRDRILAERRRAWIGV